MALLTHTVLTSDLTRERHAPPARQSTIVCPLVRLGVRCGIGGLTFSSVNGLPSTISFGPPWLSFDRFAGTMPLCDSLPPFMWVLSLIAFTHRSASL